MNENFLTKKYGPLPGWGWLVAAIAAYLLYRHFHQTSEQAAGEELAQVSSSGSGESGGGGSQGGGAPSKTEPEKPMKEEKQPENPELQLKREELADQNKQAEREQDLAKEKLAGEIGLEREKLKGEAESQERQIAAQQATEGIPGLEKKASSLKSQLANATKRIRGAEHERNQAKKNSQQHKKSNTRAKSHQAQHKSTHKANHAAKKPAKVHSGTAAAHHKPKVKKPAAHPAGRAKPRHAQKARPVRRARRR